jgi:hypothetical protein
MVSEKYMSHSSFHIGLGHPRGIAAAYIPKPMSNKIIGELTFIFLAKEGSQAIISVANPSPARIR